MLTTRCRYADEGENYRWELQDVGDFLSKCWRAEKTTASLVQEKINEREKNANFVVSGNHSPWGAHDGQNYL